MSAEEDEYFLLSLLCQALYPQTLSCEAMGEKGTATSHSVCPLSPASCLFGAKSQTLMSPVFFLSVFVYFLRLSASLLLSLQVQPLCCWVSLCRHRTPRAASLVVLWECYVRTHTFIHGAGLIDFSLPVEV